MGNKNNGSTVKTIKCKLDKANTNVVNIYKNGTKIG